MRLPVRLVFAAAAMLLSSCWWVGPPSPRPLESWVLPYTGQVPIHAAWRMAARA